MIFLYSKFPFSFTMLTLNDKYPPIHRLMITVKLLMLAATLFSIFALRSLAAI